MKQILINGIRGGQFALVDDEDYELCNKKAWSMSHSGRPRAMHKINGVWKNILMHRLILGFPNSLIDHKNRNPLDNRRCNLRICSRSENGINSPPRTRLGIKGVCRKNNRWRTRIKVMGKDICLGYFTDLREAAKAYNEGALKYFGEFAWLNPIY